MRKDETMARILSQRKATDPLHVVVLRTIHSSAIHIPFLRKNHGDLFLFCDAHAKNGDTGETKTEKQKAKNVCENAAHGAHPKNEIASLI